MKQGAGRDDYDRAMVFQDPRPLKNGKTGFHQYQAGCEFFHTMRFLGQLGYCWSWYVFDGQYANENMRHFIARQELYYEVGPDLGDDAEDLQTRDLAGGCHCVCHICSLATKWALAPWTTEEQLGDTFLVIRACIRVHTALHEKVPEFVAARASFRDVDPPEHLVRPFWAAFGVDPRMLDLMTAVHPIYAKDRLWINSKLKKTPAYYSNVCEVVCYCLRWQLFSKTRWCGVGPSQRYLVVSNLGGLRGLMEMCQGAPHVSGEDQNSFFRQNEDVLRYACIAALGCYVPEAVCLELLQDDRLALRLGEIKEVWSAELSWTMGVDQFLYETLALAFG